MHCIFPNVYLTSWFVCLKTSLFNTFFSILVAIYQMFVLRFHLLTHIFQMFTLFFLVIVFFSCLVSFQPTMFKTLERILLLHIQFQPSFIPLIILLKSKSLKILSSGSCIFLFRYFLLFALKLFPHHTQLHPSVQLSPFWVILPIRSCIWCSRFFLTIEASQ